VPGTATTAFSLLKLEQQAIFLYVLRAQVQIAMRRGERMSPAVWLLVALLIITACVRPR